MEFLGRLVRMKSGDTGWEGIGELGDCIGLV